MLTDGTFNSGTFNSHRQHYISCLSVNWKERKGFGCNSEKETYTLIQSVWYRFCDEEFMVNRITNYKDKLHIFLWHVTKFE